MWTTVAKWVGVAAVALAVVGVPVWYVDKKADEAYEAGFTAATAECNKNAAIAVLKAEENHLSILKSESEKTQILATELAKKRRDAKTLKEKLDEALNKQPETQLNATGCVLNDDATDLMRYGANGDSAAVNQQNSTLSGPPVDEMSRGATVPGGGHNTSIKRASANLPSSN